jgi:general secretion pathway protein A
LINALCDNLLLSAFATEQKSCTVEMLDEVCRDLRLEWPGSRRLRSRVADESFERSPY